MYPWALAYQYSCSIRSTVITHPLSSLSLISFVGVGRDSGLCTLVLPPALDGLEPSSAEKMPAEPLRATGAFAKKVPQFQATREAENRRDPGTGVSDVTQLLTLTEETVMQNTMVRFSRDEIYTFVGSVLLAVNPYKPIPMLYGEDVMMAFESGSLVDAPPHMYARGIIISPCHPWRRLAVAHHQWRERCW